MMGLNNKVNVKRKDPSTEKWTVIRTDLVCRITDMYEDRRFTQQMGSTTEYTHMLFCEYSATPPMQVEDHIVDGSTEYAVVGIVDAAGAAHHFEARLRRSDKK